MPKKRLLNLINSDIQLLNEEWVKVHFHNHKDYHLDDHNTATLKCNTSAHVKNVIPHVDSNNLILLNFPTFSFKLIHLYLRPSSLTENQATIDALTNSIQDTTPTIVTGDFNKHPDTHHLLCSYGFKEHNIGLTHLNQRLNSTYYNKLQQVYTRSVDIDHEIFPDSFKLSDHCLTKLVIKTNTTTTSNSRRYLRNKKTSAKISESIANGTPWLTIHSETYTRPAMLKSRIQSNKCSKADLLHQYLQLLRDSDDVEILADILATDFSTASSTAIRKIRSLDSKEGWRLLKTLSKLTKPHKPCSRVTVDSTVLSGNEANKEIVDYFAKIHNGTKEKMLDWVVFPDFNIDQMELLSWTHKLKRNKAITFDCISDGAFCGCCKAFPLCKGCNNKLERAAEVFTPEFWKSTSTTSLHLEGRLICLNKGMSLSPELSELRPILIMSPIVRLLEKPIAEELSIYCNEHCHSSQAGFLRDKTTSTNLCRLVKHVHNRNNTGFLVFFDLAKAFDSVDRRILRNLLVQKNVLSEKSLKLLDFIFKNVRVKLGRDEYQPSKGTHKVCRYHRSFSYYM